MFFVMRWPWLWTWLWLWLSQVAQAVESAFVVTAVPELAFVHTEFFAFQGPSERLLCRFLGAEISVTVTGVAGAQQQPQQQTFRLATVACPDGLLWQSGVSGERRVQLAAETRTAAVNSCADVDVCALHAVASEICLGKTSEAERAVLAEIGARSPADADAGTLEASVRSVLSFAVAHAFEGARLGISERPWQTTPWRRRPEILGRLVSGHRVESNTTQSLTCSYVFPGEVELRVQFYGPGSRRLKPSEGSWATMQPFTAFQVTTVSATVLSVERGETLARIQPTISYDRLRPFTFVFQQDHRDCHRILRKADLSLNALVDAVLDWDVRILETGDFFHQCRLVNRLGMEMRMSGVTGTVQVQCGSFSITHVLSHTQRDLLNADQKPSCAELLPGHPVTGLSFPVLCGGERWRSWQRPTPGPTLLDILNRRIL